MRTLILGDVHGNITHCIKVAENNPKNTILQLGDLGVGFIPTGLLVKALPDNFKFFVGNHDNRQEAKKFPHCIGDFGKYQNLFFVSGASSYDKAYRTEGVDWWPDEELNYQQSGECFDSWKKSDTQIIITHECPQSVAKDQFKISDPSNTRKLLQAMIEERPPKLLIHGHHHRSRRYTHGGIQYVSLGIDEVFEL